MKGFRCNDCGLDAEANGDGEVSECPACGSEDIDMGDFSLDGDNDNETPETPETDIPTRFETEFPDEAQVLIDICSCRGKGHKPMFLANPPPVIAAPKIGRNEPCPCGSNKKFKKCCGKEK